MDDATLQETLDQVRELLADGSPYATALGLKITRLEPGVAEAEIPYDEKLIGDPETGVMHGGVATALLDHVAGMAAFSALGAKAAPATLDLRIEYFRAARPGATLYACARCRKVTRHVAFIEAFAHDGDDEDHVATGTVAMMVPKTPDAASREGGA